MRVFFNFMKEPGGFRILFGSLVLILLLFMAILGEKFSPYTSSQMDTEFILEPPSVGFFRSFLVTEKALKNLNHSSYIPPPETSPSGLTESEDSEYDYLSEDPSPVENSLSENPQKKHAHYFGTDKDGRDILAMLLAGARTCILPGLITCLVALGFGLPLGILSGYFGGFLSKVISFFSGLLLSFPRFILILIVICAFEPNIYLTMVVLGITMIPRISEIFRDRVETLSRQGFVLAAKESGLSHFRIMWKHLFWHQCRTLFFIQASLIMAESILVETTLSYLQFGTKPPEISWGNIIEGSRLSFFSEYYWITFFPSMAIVISILGFFYLGDGLNQRFLNRDKR